MPNKMEMTNEKYFNLKQASDETGLSVAVIGAACRNGDLRGMQISDSSRWGFHWMVAEYDLIEWVEKRMENRYKRKPKEPTAVEQKSSTWELAWHDGFQKGYAKAMRKVRKALKELDDE